MALFRQVRGPLARRLLYRSDAARSPNRNLFDRWIDAGGYMKIAKNDVPVKIDVPGATARQLADFGDANGFGTMAGEYFSLGEGTDIAPLLEGLEGNLCQSPHWGYVLEGRLTVAFGDGSAETVNGGDLFYWPPGHTVKAEQATEFILFSPQKEHCRVIDHILGKLRG